jgi:hypothetical protein
VQCRKGNQKSVVVVLAKKVEWVMSGGGDVEVGRMLRVERHQDDNQGGCM